MKIQLNDVSKKYDQVVLDHIDLTVEGHSTVAIIGKSGCGKSTLLRLMTGIEVPDKGKISVNGHVVTKSVIRDYQNRISIVFQQHNLFPHLSLLQNITLILEKRRHMSKEAAEKKASFILKQLHLGEELHKRPRFVSGGQAQRGSIARALATEPELVFMDEPTAALDPLLTKEVLDAVLELKRTGTEFVFVTHEISFVRRFADYVLFMDEGKISEQGSVEMLDAPKTASLKEFLLHERG